jgi:hypothetical protein
MQTEIKRGFIAQYAFGRGGVDIMTGADRKAVGQMLRVQFDALDGFMGDIRANGLSEAAIAARAELYSGAAVQAHGAGMAAARGIELPAQPGDGSSPCLGRDRCAWSIDEFDDRWEATWKTRSDAAVCPVCKERGSAWNPLVIQKK